MEVILLQANSSVTSSPGPFLGTPGEEGGVGLGAPHSLDSRGGTVWGGRVLLVEDQSVRYKHVGLWVKMSCSILVVTVVYQLNSLKLATVGHMREHPHS